jgi:hypothetical protein
MVMSGVRKLDGVSWIVQAALLLAAMTPAFYWDLTGNSYFSAGKIFSTFVASPALLSLYRYFVVRVALEQFAAHEVAQASLAAASTQSDTMEGLLEGLLPPHVPLSERVHARYVAACAAVPLAPNYVQLWYGMAILQIHVAFSPVADVTAVVTAGAAYSTLLGAALLTYRLFGAAVRENDAIIGAAPRGLPGSQPPDQDIAALLCLGLVCETGAELRRSARRIARCERRRAVRRRRPRRFSGPGRRHRGATRSHRLNRNG